MQQLIEDRKENQDIQETVNLVESSALEDEIFVTVDKLQALCSVQAELESNECAVSTKTRIHYSLIMEELVKTLRKQLERRFD